MKLLFACLFALSALGSFAQQKPTELDKSPMDISYCPQNYPILRMSGKAGDQPYARVIYSRPQCNGRKIFGDIVRYNQVWRMGANEATEIEFFRNVKIGGKLLAKGRYTLYAICNESKWTIVINGDKDYWGLVQNPKKDVLRTDVTIQKLPETVEALTIYFDDLSKNNTNLNIMWDDSKASLPITLL
ncbi:DUF2911 domain-containing protein [Deminuibacter soli]|uniref:DUF2911 domain-containing protein n=1 Tax=Deminuibacter soli TaxID=2291815 RepID=A0A3E1NRB3_9BACT|nr:DUF2911 domain-containing protein [Deminuibacter soli]RFM30437.1 DUF2911 domain-containing protein [Deminuibacter soli]